MATTSCQDFGFLLGSDFEAKSLQSIDCFLRWLLMAGDQEEAFKVYENCAVVRCSGRCEQSRYGELLVVNVIAFGTTVNESEFRADRPAVFSRDTCANHCVKWSNGQLAFQTELLTRPVLNDKVLWGCSDDREATDLRDVTHRDRNGVVDPVTPFLVFAQHVFGQYSVRQRFTRFSDAVDRAQDIGQIAAWRSDHQVVTNAALTERVAHHTVDDQHGDHQHDAQCNAQHGQGR